jgi:hypothetical protein
MKYIVLRSGKFGLEREFPIIFPNSLTHSDVFQALIKECPELDGANPVAAGELSSININAGCHGFSSTLGEGSREEMDDNLIRMIDYTHGIF